MGVRVNLSSAFGHLIRQHVGLHWGHGSLDTHAERQKFYVIVRTQCRLWHTIETCILSAVHAGVKASEC